MPHCILSSNNLIIGKHTMPPKRSRSSSGSSPSVSSPGSLPPRMARREMQHAQQCAPNCSLATTQAIGKSFGYETPGQKQMLTQINERNSKRHGRVFGTGKTSTGIPNALHRYGMGAYEIPTTKRNIVSKAKGVIDKQHLPYLMGEVIENNQPSGRYHVMPVHSTTPQGLNVMDPALPTAREITFDQNGCFSSGRNTYRPTLYGARDTRFGDATSLVSNTQVGMRKPWRP